MRVQASAVRPRGDRQAGQHLPDADPARQHRPLRQRVCPRQGRHAVCGALEVPVPGQGACGHDGVGADGHGERSCAGGEEADAVGAGEAGGRGVCDSGGVLRGAGGGGVDGVQD